MMDDFSKPPERPVRKLDSLGERGSASMQSRHYNGVTGPVGASALLENSSETAFRPPEEVAASADTPTTQGILPPLEHHREIGATVEIMERKSGKWWTRLKDLSRKQWIIIGTTSVVAILVLTGIITYVVTSKKAAPVSVKSTARVATAPQTKPIVSPLTGLPVTSAQRDLSVIGVMIENSPDARPQSGLDQAGVVFEAIAEAGITRFLALFQESTPGVIGPVRSSRPYYLDWAMAFDASYAHVGGSPDALQRIKDISVKDMDQFYNAGAYHRVSNRFAPHNMYTSMDSLRTLANSKDFTKSTFTPFVRKAKESPSKMPTAKTIDFGISGAFYNAHYDYDPASNSYKRSEGGAPHIDNETKAQLSPKVVIALAMPYSLMADGYHSDYQTIGSGNMLLFQDGIVIPGTWSKAGPTSQFIFKDGQGKDMQLNPGQTWISIVDDITKATYAP